ncbi:hypothetical protein HPB49_026387 [Dermacentor silvarum]|nr:hypothetical protein HPB49_026387 [Dermacentor silvarum]
MEMVAKWYAVHDIGGLKLRGQHREPFYATDDERLLWLEVDFINYIEDLQLSGSRSKQKITKETYEATLLTTRSTVAVIEYLLDHAKFRYVLTRGFNSDPVESFFSCLRQFNGGNDRVDARAAVFSVERLLKVGILHAAKTGNAPSSSESNAAVSVPSQDNDVPSCPVEIKHAARELSGELECVNYCAQAQDELEIDRPVCPSITGTGEVAGQKCNWSELEIAPIAFLAGYLARAGDEKLLCHQCKKLLQVSKPTEAVYGLMKNLDSGHIKCPTPQLIGICQLTCNFINKVTKSVEVRRSGKLCTLLLSALLPHFTLSRLDVRSERSGAFQETFRNAFEEVTSTFALQLGWQRKCNG